MSVDAVSIQSLKNGLANLISSRNASGASGSGVFSSLLSDSSSSQGSGQTGLLSVLAQDDTSATGGGSANTQTVQVKSQVSSQALSNYSDAVSQNTGSILSSSATSANIPASRSQRAAWCPGVSVRSLAVHPRT